VAGCELTVAFHVLNLLFGNLKFILKKHSVADAIGSSSKQDDTFEESLNDTQNERKEESTGRQEIKSTSTK